MYLPDGLFYKFTQIFRYIVYMCFHHVEKSTALLTLLILLHMKQDPSCVYHDRYVELGVLIAIVCKEHHIVTRKLHELSGLHPRHLSSIKKRRGAQPGLHQPPAAHAVHPTAARTRGTAAPSRHPAADCAAREITKNESHLLYMLEHHR